MLNGITRWIVTFFFLSCLLTWCFLNRGVVLFDYSPLHDPLRIPLFAVLLVTTIGAFIWGMVMTWLGGASLRRENKELKRAARLHEKEGQNVGLTDY